MIGLTASDDELKRRINERVEERIAKGFEKEIEFLKRNNFWDGVVQKTLGYKDWPDIKKWKLEEFKYAKRQITWFKKEKRINWFDITLHDYAEEVEKLTKKWYSQANNA
jgi:tRNA dimethylallyltransferase